MKCWGIGTALVLILLCGLFVRTNALSDLGLESDETLHIYTAKSLLQDGTPTLPSGLQYPRALLYSWSVALSFKLFGISEFSARLPSVICGIGSIILIFLVGRSLFNAYVGLIAAFLIAFLPFEIVFSRMSRMYAMYQFFYLLSLFGFYKAFEPGETSFTGDRRDTNPDKHSSPVLQMVSRGKWFIVFGVSFIIAKKLHTPALLLLASIPVYLCMMSALTWANGNSRQMLRSKYFLSLIVVFVIGAVYLALPQNYEKIVGLSNISPPETVHFKTTAKYYLAFLSSHYMLPIRFFFPLAAIMMVFRASKPGFYLLVCAMVPLIIHSGFVSIQMPRYIYEFLPIILLISAYGIYHLFEVEYRVIENSVAKFKLRSSFSINLFRTFFILCFVGFILFNFPGLKYAIRIDRFAPSEFGGLPHADRQSAFDFIKKVAQPGDVIITDLPLAADFYGINNTIYHLDNWEEQRFRDNAGGGLRNYHLSNVKAIVDLDDFMAVTAKHPRGWIVMDKFRFGHHPNIPAEISNYITKNFAAHLDEVDKSMIIFSWDKAK
jgi:4-amino-4-deoxy-L-arabinose transferase-like glycosyltransferase